MACFKIDSITQLDHALKRKVSLNVHKLVFGDRRRSIVYARLEEYIFGCYLVFIDVVAIFFVYTDMAVVFAANCLRNPLK